MPARSPRRGDGRDRHARLNRCACPVAAALLPIGSIVGLGNPGSEYAQHPPQHRLRGGERAGPAVGPAQAEVEVPRAADRRPDRPGGPRVAVLLPQTYMNEAGQSAGPARGAFKVPLERVLVIHREASASAALFADGTALVRAGTQDIGTGTYTVMTQVAADALGLPTSRVRFELGDTGMPETPTSGGSATAASVGSAVHKACAAVKDRIGALARPGESYADTLRRNRAGQHRRRAEVRARRGRQALRDAIVRRADRRGARRSRARDGARRRASSAPSPPGGS